MNEVDFKFILYNKLCIMRFSVSCAAKGCPP